jgi:hypothetical protein
MRKELESAFWMLRVGFGVAPALAGLDEIFRTNLARLTEVPESVPHPDRVSLSHAAA